MSIRELNSKDGCIGLAIEHLKQLQGSAVRALAWLERSDAFTTDESKDLQEVKAALAKSIEREGELDRLLANCLVKERRLVSFIQEISKIGVDAKRILEDTGQPLGEGHQDGGPKPHKPYLDQEKYGYTAIVPVIGFSGYAMRSTRILWGQEKPNMDMPDIGTYSRGPDIR